MPKYFKIIFLFIGLVLWSGLSLAQEIKFSSDITRLAVGARPLGMGKTFCGLADDISAMYLNPAGLAFLAAPQALSLSGKFVNTVNYFTLAGATPASIGTLGIGYTSAGIGFSAPNLNLVEIATGEYRVIPSSNESVSFDYQNQVLAFTYGTTFFRENLAFGTTLKLFSENISGSSNGSSLGKDLDIGLLFKPNAYINLGLVAQNVLPVEQGGKITWDTGQKEAIPTTITLGTNIKLTTSGELNLGADYSYQPELGQIPGFWHLGIEWWPTPIFAARAGLDQDVIGSGTGTAFETVNNLTSGVSLKFDSFRFDYAYHKYNDLSNNDTHYFSLVFEGLKFIPLQITEPSDQLITHASTIKVAGFLQDHRVAYLQIKDQVVQASKGSFEAEVSLDLGKNTIWVAGFDRHGKLVVSKKTRVLRLIQYKDIPNDYWARETIEELGTLALMPGYKDNTFHPEKETPRANFLISLLNIGEIPPAEQLDPFPFVDIKTSDSVAPYAKAGYDTKLVVGYPDKTFRPWRILNRLEGAIMAVRFSNFTLDEVLERPYLDITARHWAINEISAAKQNNLLKFALEYLYPKKKITRAELAIMLANTPKVLVQVQALLDFEAGYEIIYPYQGVNGQLN